MPTLTPTKIREFNRALFFGLKNSTKDSVNQHWPQYVIGGLIVGLFVAVVGFPDGFRDMLDTSFSWSVRRFGFFWQVLTVFLLFATLSVALSPKGKIRLGSGKTEISYFSWLAIIMSTLLAGGGIFWSAAEPLFHTQTIPLPLEHVESSGPAKALAQSYMHWGFLAWTALGTLSIIPLQRVAANPVLRNRPCALLHGVVPDKYLQGAFGHIIDIIAVFSVLIGTIGPIGFLGSQLGFIISEYTPLPNNTGTQLMLIALLAAVYTVSAVRGVKRGIRILSLFNMALCAIFGVFIASAVSGTDLIDISSEAGGRYISSFFSMAFVDSTAAWTHDWTHFFWGWFLGYGPIMSIFIFKISKGRSLRQIFLTICIVAPLVTNFWFTLIGGSGILLNVSSGGAVSDSLSANGMPSALMAIINQTPQAAIAAAVAVPLIFFFMATTGDSIALSVASVFSRSEEPDKRSRIFWAVSMAAVAAAVLAAGREEAVSLLQQSIVTAAVPVSILMLLAAVAGVVALVKNKSDTLE